MAELSDVKAYSNGKDHEQLPPIGAYKIQKVLINGDFLAKDKLDDSFLLSSTNRLSDFHKFDFQGTNIVQPIQIIEEHNQMYEVFPLDKKLVWAGEIINKNKSEIYCVTLLYSTIRHILKPLKLMRLFNCEKYLNLENIWVKDNTLFLFLRSKGSGKNLLKTENTRPNKRFYRVEETQSWNEVSIIKKIGDLFCEMFFGKDNGRETSKLETFKEIIKSMCKGEMTLEELENLMNDKKAIKKFMSNRKANSRRILYDTLEANRGKDTIDLAYQRLENIPINMGRPMNGMLFSNDKRYNAQLRQERRGKTLVFSSLDSDVPPSFSNSKRFKKMSLFANSKTASRRYSQSNRYENDSQNGPQTKRMSIANEDTQKNFSFAAKDFTPNKMVSPQQTFFKSNKKRNIKIREMFNGLNKQELLTSKLDKFHERSKEKALRKIKESLSMDQQSYSMEINDQKFRSALKERKNLYVKQVNSYFQKAQEHYENLRSKAGSVTTTNMEKFNQWQQGVEKGLNEIRIEVSREKEVHNEMFVEERTGRADVPALQQRLFESRYESSQGNRSEVMDNLGLKQQDKNKGKKNRFDEELFTAAKQKDFEMANLSVHQSNHVRTKSDSSNVQKQSKELQKKQPTIKQETIKEKEVVYKKSQSQVELIPMNNIIAKLQPSQPPVVKEQIRIKEEPIPVIQAKPQIPPKVIAAPIIAVNKPNGFFEQVQQNMFNEIPSPQQYTYISKIPEPKKEVELQQHEKPSPRPPVAKKEKAKIKSSASKFGEFSDQIEEVSLGVKQEKKPPKEVIKEQKKPLTPKEKPNPNPNTTTIAANANTNTNANTNATNRTQMRQQSVNGRSKTNQSNASSNGIKSVRKQIDQYIFLINKMGEAVAKTAKLSKKLEKIEWYVGVYFLYKRFYYQRKNIERYLEDNIPKLTRYEEFSEQEWNEWLQKGERQALLTKCKQDNVNIENSLKRMVKKVEVKQLPSRVLLNANVNKNNPQSTKIAVQYVVDEYDLAVEMNLLSDPEISIHLCEMINALYVIGQLDGKITEKKKISQFTRVNRSPQQLSQMVQIIFDLYEQDS